MRADVFCSVHLVDGLGLLGCRWRSRLDTFIVALVIVIVASAKVWHSSSASTLLHLGHECCKKGRERVLACLVG